MIPFKKILVATDFGPSSEGALELALGLAKRCDADLTVLHVWEVPAFAYSGHTYSVRDVLRPIRDKAQIALDECVARAGRGGARVTGLLRAGTPWEEIRDAISELKPDVVVVGTHGRNIVSRALLGSVAEKTVRTSSVPVLTVRAIAPAHAA
jgi:nucleotide-binding universal stress UspA family protein